MQARWLEITDTIIIRETWRAYLCRERDRKLVTILEKGADHCFSAPEDHLGRNPHTTSGPNGPSYCL